VTQFVILASTVDGARLDLLETIAQQYTLTKI
jgi:hypothetical protein